MSDPTLLWAPQAWIHDGWKQRVLLRIGTNGSWSGVSFDTSPPPEATQLPGPALPGLVNAHSHAFQRAFAGLAERRSGTHDDFWSWRDRMYAVALRISPEMLQAVAAELYAELLLGGYTHVCEFHYLHHAPDGSRYGDPLTMCHALIAAARAAGIGLTLLPVVYERAGFMHPALREDQRRFAAGVDEVLTLRDAIRALHAPLVSAGVAIHSLRAARPDSITRLGTALRGDPAPIHVHIAEQVAEVTECHAATGLRPIEWLAQHVALDSRWQLVHATHATTDEIEAVARTGAGVVLCPSTEANLGDGLCDLPAWLRLNVPLTIGSDSQVARAWSSELRLLEYGQRLVQRQRNVAATPELSAGSSAGRLFGSVVAGGAAAAGLALSSLVPGARADLVVLDTESPGLRGIPSEHMLDALVFASDAPAISAVWVAGRQVVRDARHVAHGSITTAFAAAMKALWNAL